MRDVLTLITRVASNHYYVKTAAKCISKSHTCHN